MPWAIVLYTAKQDTLVACSEFAQKYHARAPFAFVSKVLGVGGQIISRHCSKSFHPIGRTLRVPVLSSPVAAPTHRPQSRPTDDGRRADAKLLLSAVATYGKLTGTVSGLRWTWCAEEERVKLRTLLMFGPQSYMRWFSEVVVPTIASSTR